MFARTLLFFSFATAAFAQGDKVTNIEIVTMRGQMKYDTEEFRVAPGAKVRLTLKNEDDMHHNLVICKPGEGIEQEVAKEAWDLGADGFAKQWIPQHESLLFATKMADPKTSVVLEFTAPKEPGIYPYVCTLPGHSIIMNGEMIVGEGGAPSGGKNGLSELTFVLYEGKWNKLPDFDKLEAKATDHVRGGLISLKVAKKLSNHFGIVFRAKLEAPSDGNYKFKLSSDDGTRLILGGKTVIDHDGIHATSSKDGSIALKQGSHDFELQYFEGAGEETLALSWSGPGFKDLALSDNAPRNNDRKSPSGMEIIPPKNEAVIYRNFIEGAGSRAIGVGYPNQANIAFDSDQCRLALVWQGAFIDAARHWNGRGQGFQPPLGYNIYSCVEGVPFAELKDFEKPWPDTARKTSTQQPDNGYIFKGYTLTGDNRYPEFRYVFPGGEVTERYTPEPAKEGGTRQLTRTVTINPTGDHQYYFRAASAASIEAVDGQFLIDGGKMRMLLETYPWKPVLRKIGDRTELLLPVPMKRGKQVSFTQTFVFTP